MVGQVAEGNRKDIREAVEAAHKAAPGSVCEREGKREREREREKEGERERVCVCVRERERDGADPVAGGERGQLTTEPRLSTS